MPVGALSIYDPIHLGTDENGMPVAVTLAYRNLLAGVEPGAGKSSVLNLIVGHGALPPTADCGSLTANASNWDPGATSLTCSSAPTPTTP